MRKIWFKQITLILVLTLASSEIHADTFGDAINPPTAAPSALLGSLSNLVIPEQFGKIQDQFVGHQAKTVIHIQDAHGNLSAQENLAALVKYFYETYGIHLVAVEAGSAAGNLRAARSFPDQKVRREISHSLLQMGKLSGEEFYVISDNPKGLELVGVEDFPLYRKNVSQYVNQINEKEKRQRLTREMEAAVGAIMRSTLSQKKRLLLEGVDGLHEGNKPPEIFLAELNRILNETNAELSLALIEAELVSKWFKTRNEKIAYALHYQMRLLQKLLNLRLTAEELDIFKKHSSLLSTEKTKRLFLILKSAKYWRGSFNDFHRMAKANLSFYRIALRRDIALGSNTLNTLDTFNANAVILISGGLHTSGLTRYFKQKGISYYVITPHIEGIDLAREGRRYERAVSNTAQVLNIGAPKVSALRAISIMDDGPRMLDLYARMGNRERLNFIEHARTRTSGFGSEVLKNNIPSAELPKSAKNFWTLKRKTIASYFLVGILSAITATSGILSAITAAIIRNMLVFSFFTAVTDAFGQWMAGRGMNWKQAVLALPLGAALGLITSFGFWTLNMLIPADATGLTLVTATFYATQFFVLTYLFGVIMKGEAKSGQLKKIAKQLVEPLLLAPAATSIIFALFWFLNYAFGIQITGYYAAMATLKILWAMSVVRQRTYVYGKFVEFIRGKEKHGAGYHEKQQEAFWMSRLPSYAKNAYIQLDLPPAVQVAVEAMFTQFFALFYTWAVNKEGFILNPSKWPAWWHESKIILTLFPLIGLPMWIIKNIKAFLSATLIAASVYGGYLQITRFSSGMPRLDWAAAIIMPLVILGAMILGNKKIRHKVTTSQTHLWGLGVAAAALLGWSTVFASPVLPPKGSVGVLPYSITLWTMAIGFLFYVYERLFGAVEPTVSTNGERHIRTFWERYFPLAEDVKLMLKRWGTDEKIKSEMVLPRTQRFGGRYFSQLGPRKLALLGSLFSQTLGAGTLYWSFSYGLTPNDYAMLSPLGIVLLPGLLGWLWMGDIFPFSKLKGYAFLTVGMFVGALFQKHPELAGAGERVAPWHAWTLGFASAAFYGLRQIFHKQVFKKDLSLLTVYEQARLPMVVNRLGYLMGTAVMIAIALTGEIINGRAISIAAFFATANFVLVLANTLVWTGMWVLIFMVTQNKGFSASRLTPILAMTSGFTVLWQWMVTGTTNPVLILSSAMIIFGGFMGTFRKEDEQEEQFKESIPNAEQSGSRDAPLVRPPPKGFGSVRTEIGSSNGIGTIWIDNAKSFPTNVLDRNTLEGISSAIQDFNARDEVKAIIIRGANRVFSGGGDLRALIQSQTVEEASEYSRLAKRVVREEEESPKWVAAIIEGSAVGAGLQLAIGADLIIASPNATFRMPEIALDVNPGFSGLIKLPRIMGVRKVLEFLLSGDKIGASEALASGLIHAVAHNPAEEAIRIISEKLETGAKPEIRDWDAITARQKSEVFGDIFDPSSKFNRLMVNENNARINELELKRRAEKHVEAVQALLGTVKLSYTMPFEEALELDTMNYARLAMSHTAKSSAAKKIAALHPTVKKTLTSLRRHQENDERFVHLMARRALPETIEIYKREAEFYAAVTSAVARNSKFGVFLVSAIPDAANIAYFTYMKFKRIVDEAGDKAKDVLDHNKIGSQLEALVDTEWGRTGIIKALAEPIHRSSDRRYRYMDRQVDRLLSEIEPNRRKRISIDRGASWMGATDALRKTVGGIVIGTDIIHPDAIAESALDIPTELLAEGLVSYPKMKFGGRLRFQMADIRSERFEHLRGRVNFIRDGSVKVYLNLAEARHAVQIVFNLAASNPNGLLYQDSKTTLGNPGVFNHSIFHIGGKGPRDWTLKYVGYLSEPDKLPHPWLKDEAIAATENNISELFVAIHENGVRTAELLDKTESAFDTFGRVKPEIIENIQKKLRSEFGLSEIEEGLLKDILIISPWTQHDEYIRGFYLDKGVTARHEIARDFTNERIDLETVLESLKGKIRGLAPENTGFGISEFDVQIQEQKLIVINTPEALQKILEAAGSDTFFKHLKGKVGRIVIAIDKEEWVRAELPGRPIDYAAFLGRYLGIDILRRTAAGGQKILLKQEIFDEIKKGFILYGSPEILPSGVQRFVAQNNTEMTAWVIRVVAEQRIIGAAA